MTTTTAIARDHRRGHIALVDDRGHTTATLESSGNRLHLYADEASDLTPQTALWLSVALKHWAFAHWPKGGAA